MRQRGFMLPGGLLAYGIVGLAIIATLAGVAWKIRQAGYAAAVEDYRPKLEACAKRADALEGALATQERAVQALKAEGDARVAKAAEGLRRAVTEAQGARSEAARLRALAGTLREPTACPAGEAVKAIREGLQAK